VYLRVPPGHHALPMDLDLKFLKVCGATHVLLDMFMYKDFSGFVGLYHLKITRVAL
jgi:hypothetical protein